MVNYAAIKLNTTYILAKVWMWSSHWMEQETALGILGQYKVYLKWEKVRKSVYTQKSFEVYIWACLSRLYSFKTF